MKRLLIAPAIVLLMLAAPVRAEKPTPTRLGLDSTISPGELKATPEMWFYDQQLRQYNDPKLAVRAKADMRAEQRQRRIESMKWFGFSNARPQANSDPFHGDYSPRWTSNSSYYPARWNGVGPGWIVVQP